MLGGDTAFCAQKQYLTYFFRPRRIREEEDPRKTGLRAKTGRIRKTEAERIRRTERAKISLPVERRAKSNSSGRSMSERITRDSKQGH